jgi:hypothetical protein
MDFDDEILFSATVDRAAYLYLHYMRVHLDTLYSTEENLLLLTVCPLIQTNVGYFFSYIPISS